MQVHLTAHQLTLQHASDNADKLTRALVEAKVDLNPHQVDAALFAFKTPLSKGAILADEVGLGKTIEAGLLLTQYWAEDKRRLLVLCPASLRTQWRDELAEKFYLDAVILDSRSAKEFAGNPFDQVAAGTPRVVIASYHFASAQMDSLMTPRWDLAVLDEAHRLRNVYKGAKIGTNIKAALRTTPKVLLTATPLQNTVSELYGLVSLIDEEAFGDPKTFSRMYARVSDGTDRFEDLKARLAPFCHRTLRRDVGEYVQYTNRRALTQDFEPTEAEQELYDRVSDYLAREELWALPNAQRTLIELVLRKLLASSTYAIAGALATMVARLERELRDAEALIAEGSSSADHSQSSLGEQLNDEELDGEFADDELQELSGESSGPVVLSQAQLGALAGEIGELAEFRDLAEEIVENAKGQALVKVLETAFSEGAKLGASRKAVIFTESRRTQAYVTQLLEANGYAGKIVRFAGTNTDAAASAIYDAWRRRNAGSPKVTGSRAVDMRAALVDAFKSDDIEILIATEAAAEGINLQFCSILVNYDLPWNPQRVEQRIGRCHRYGQKHDVLVVNFRNTANAADMRVHELLSEKFQLFEGVFGASDEVLGAIGSGVDIERRISDIYRTCRTNDEITEQFEQLQLEFAESIDQEMQSTRTKLIEHFDAQVHDRLKVRLEQSRTAVSRVQQQIAEVVAYAYDCEAASGIVRVKDVDLTGEPSTVTFTLDESRDGRQLRLGDPVVRHAVDRALEPVDDAVVLEFDYSGWAVTARELDPLVGTSGVLTAAKLIFDGGEREEHLVLAAVSDQGRALSPEQVSRLLEVPAVERVLDADGANALVPDGAHIETQRLVDEHRERTDEWMEAEYQKLERWADDERARLRSALDDATAQIKDFDRRIRLAGTAPEKLALRREKREWEKRHDAAQLEYDAAVKVFDAGKDSMLDDIERTLRTEPQVERLLTARWVLR